MNYFMNIHHFFPILRLHSKLQYIFFPKLSEWYFIVKIEKGGESGFPYCFLTDFTKFLL